MFSAVGTSPSTCPYHSLLTTTAVTAGIQALMHMETAPTDGFRKLNFLLSNPPFPPETFGNLLLLHCKHGYFDLAADILAENAHLSFKLISAELYEYLEAAIMVGTSPEEAYRKYDELTGQLRTLSVTVSFVNIL
jgi:tetratricopeptide repeat protein 30